MHLQGRGVLITGGSRGIGKAVAFACLRAGADILVCGRDLEALHATGRELLKEAPSGQKVVIMTANVADRQRTNWQRPQSISFRILLES